MEESENIPIKKEPLESNSWLQTEPPQDVWEMTNYFLKRKHNVDTSKSTFSLLPLYSPPTVRAKTQEVLHLHAYLIQVKSVSTFWGNFQWPPCFTLFILSSTRLPEDPPMERKERNVEKHCYLVYKWRREVLQRSKTCLVFFQVHL